MIEIEKKVELNRIAFYIKGTGTPHREDGPAIIWGTGYKEWRVNGYLHREDGPAIVDEGIGHEKWYINGMLHREDGPAIILGNGTVRWYLKNKPFSKEQWFEALNEEQKEKVLYSEYFIRG
jgi:hypothetical protein